MLEGSLFTRDYLVEGVRETAAWRRLGEAELAALADKLRHALAGFSPSATENEDVTKQDLIYPVLDTLGWASRLGEQRTERKGRAEVPDVPSCSPMRPTKRAHATSASRRAAGVMASRSWRPSVGSLRSTGAPTRCRRARCWAISRAWR